MTITPEELNEMKGLCQPEDTISRLIAEVERLREVEKEVDNFIHVALSNARIFTHENECYEKVIKGGSREDCVCGVTNVVDAFNKLQPKGGNDG